VLNPLGDRGAATISAWLDGLSRRQQAISDNIANIDTPGYSAREVPFEAELQRALGTGRAELATTNERHIGTSGRHSEQLGLQAAQLLTSSRRDGNNVDIDQQMVLLAETQMRYRAAASALTSKLSILRIVMQRG
jgi:flagellar basal-body rod protein FlgB